jgi:hypothetical protein
MAIARSVVWWFEVRMILVAVSVANFKSANHSAANATEAEETVNPGGVGALLPSYHKIKNV